MRIGIDARLYGTEGRGLGRYISQLLLHLEKVDPDNKSAIRRSCYGAGHKNEYVVFLTRKGFVEYQPTEKNFKKVLCDISWYGLREQFALPFLLYLEQCDLVHFPHFNVPIWYKGKFAVTIHDFILYDFPTTRATTRSAMTFWVKYAAYRFVFWSAIQRAQHIFVPSEYVRDRLQYHYPSVGDTKVTVTKEGAFSVIASSAKQSHNRSQIASSHGIRNDNYILAVGSAYPHKNLEALIQAFLNLTKSHFVRLVIVGKKDYFIRCLENLTKSHFVKFVGEVGDEELAGLYANAKAVAVVSCEEGFGLPGVEAMRYGTPVVASDRSSLPEVYRESAYYVNPYDVRDIERVMLEILRRPHPNPLLTGEGSSFSSKPAPTEASGEKAGMKSEDAWQKLAEATKAVYESIV